MMYLNEDVREVVFVNSVQVIESLLEYSVI